jgi:hypothetical protein
MKNQMVGIAKSERVVVSVRMRPFTDDETKKDNTTPIETFDKNAGVIIGMYCI